jgi:hypothetical protein
MDGENVSQSVSQSLNRWMVKTLPIWKKGPHHSLHHASDGVLTVTGLVGLRLLAREGLRDGRDVARGSSGRRCCCGRGRRCGWRGEDKGCGCSRTRD